MKSDEVQLFCYPESFLNHKTTMTKLIINTSLDASAEK